MFRATEELRDKIPYDIFADSEVKAALRDAGSDDARYGRMRRCFRRGEIIRLRRGLYAFAPKYRQAPLNLFRVSNLLVAPSYVSLLSALQHHELIADRIESVQAVSRDRGRTYRTSVGHFTYRRHPCFSTIGVQLHNGALIASPTRAIVDLLYLRHAPTLHDLQEKARLDEAFRPDSRELRALVKQTRTADLRMVEVCREIAKAGRS